MARALVCWPSDIDLGDHVLVGGGRSSLSFLEYKAVAEYVGLLPADEDVFS